MRTSRAIVRTIEAGQHQSTGDLTFGNLLWQAAHDILRTEENLAARANRIALDMAHLARRLEKAEEQPYFNSLGELQSQGPELDRLCGVLDLAYENFDRLYAAWDKTLLRRPDRPGGEE